MKQLIAICIIMLSATAAHAQTNVPADPMRMLKQLQNMSPEQQAAFVQQMQAQATKASACFSQIDQAKIQALQVRGQTMSNQIDALCAQGKDKEAERYAMREGKKMMRDRTVKELQSCSKDMVKQFEAMSLGQGKNNQNICGR